MPGVSRAQRAEAKYNVVLDYPNLGLHSAAMSGNLGLVRYALDHGQPVNSAMDGVLPLHAASFGGSEIVVQTLIEHGADVNAARLPRRYSTDKHRGATPPLVITGASGSTSLHFASMHGHTSVVLTLLLHGAHPDRTDKHGLTPEIIARQNGHNDCADVLQQWAHNKDADLRKREVPPSQSVDEPDKGHPYCGKTDCFLCANRKRIRVKRSIDNAIHILRHSSSSTSAAVTPPHSAGLISTSNSMQPPSPTDMALGKYTFYPTSESAVEDFPPRRPSLPDVFEVPRSASTAHRSRRPSNLSGTSSRRPRSAGSDADQCSVGQRVKGKISLLNIFKRGNEGTPDSASPSGSVVTSTSASPAPTSTLAMSTVTSRSSETLASFPAEPSSSAGNQLHQRMLGEATPSPLSSGEPRRVVSRESLRGNSSLLSNDPFAKASPSTRPGILRAHGRSSSSGQSAQGDTSRSGSGPPSGRALRFDSSSPGVSASTRRPESRARDARAGSRSPARVLHGYGSTNSLRSRSPGSPWGMRFEGEPENMQTPPPPADPEKYSRGSIEEEDEHAYGEPVKPQVGINELQMRLSDLTVKSRRMSVESRASDLDSQDTIGQRFDCPFSINCPPPEEYEAPGQLPQQSRAGLDSRLRGNSMSSMVTDSSGGPPSSCVPTPALQHPNLPSPFVFSPSLGQADLPSPGETPEKEFGPTQAQSSPGRRARGPMDINIRQISSHAQAEALVQRAQQRILDMTEESELEEVKTFGINLGEGHTPLSAKLAAYGESLAIERKFKQEEENRRRSLVIESVSDRTLVNQGGAVQRKLSLQERAYSNPTVMLREDERRPHTSDGEAHVESADGFLSPPPNVIDLSISDPGRRGRLHHLSPSASASSTPPSHYKTRSETLPIPPDKPLIPRSRTPDPDASFGSLSSSMGIPLTRYPTCPPEDTILPRNDLLTKQERQAARAQKLAKMGFSSGAEPWKESPAYTRNHRHNRFGGIKTLVQSLTSRV